MNFGSLNRAAHAIASCVCLMVPFPATADPLPRIPCEVESVYDGDTFTASPCHPWPGLTTTARVRVLDIDAPEMGWRADCERELLLAEEATALAEELLADGVLLHVEGRDSFGRILAHVELPDGRDFAHVMLDAGLALPYAERDDGWC